MSDDATRIPLQACQVFPANDIYVTQGVNISDPLGLPGDVCLGDVYELWRSGAPQRLVVANASGRQEVAAGSDVGQPGQPVESIARYTLMDEEGYRVDLQLLRIGEGSLWALPLSPMAIGSDYTLVKAEVAPVSPRLADLLCLSFGRGTMITLANGMQRAIEGLAPGDMVLTRDHGAQPVRWISRATLRAVGAFAPVIISAGAMGNAGDLIVSQHHRMFLYQRRRISNQGTSELLVQARELVDGDAVFQREGGFVDYFAVVFDWHEIIYAEGIPVESLLVTDATISRLPPELSADLRARFPGLAQVQHFGTEVGRQMLDLPQPPSRPIR